LSVTVTLKPQLRLSPTPSVTLNDNAVLPVLKTLPLLGPVRTGATLPQLSLAVTL